MKFWKLLNSLHTKRFKKLFLLIRSTRDWSTSTFHNIPPTCPWNTFFPELWKLCTYICRLRLQFISKLRVPKSFFSKMSFTHVIEILYWSRQTQNSFVFCVCLVLENITEEWGRATLLKTIAQYGWRIWDFVSIFLFINQCVWYWILCTW